MMSESATGTSSPAQHRFARELTTVVVAPALIWLIGWAPAMIYVAVISAVAIIALHEFLTLGERKGYEVEKTLSILLLIVMLASFVTDRLSVEVGVFAVLLIIPAWYVFKVGDLEEALPATAVCVLSTLYIGMLGGALLRLRLDFPAGGKLVFFLLIVVWSGDAGAYYVGRRFGRRRLSPKISPKKTVEGAFGGVVASILAAVIIHFTFFREFPVLHAVAAAGALSLTGLVGDLAESLWKRSAAVKDSGTLIPGHGGFFDRSDSILFTAPILYAYWFLLDERIVQ